MTSRNSLLKPGEVGTRHVSRIELRYAWDVCVPGFEPDNAGFDEARVLLSDAEKAHPEIVHVYDTVSKPEGLAVYEQVVKPSAAPGATSRWDYSVNPFGSNQSPGCWTGREVPLLLVYFENLAVPLAAPYREPRSVHGPRGDIRTILDVLRMLGPAEQEYLFGSQLSPAGGGG